ncbi:MAG: hypothetical protein OXU78_07090, partial [Deltaproteobacteria bacterium]|nr:hypothetical protein [Deltaproteobacteria bacterium]
GGTGITAGDYDITAPSGIATTATGGTLTITNPGDTSTENEGTITLSLSADMLSEADEDVQLTLGTVTTVGEVSASGTPSVTINANEPSMVSVARTAPAGTGEVEEGDDVTLTVTLSTSSGGAVMVPWTAVMGPQSQRAGPDGGTAMPNSDASPDLETTATGATTSVDGSGITTLSGTLTIPAGTMTGTVVITPTNDGLAEGDESFVFTIDTPTGAAGSGTLSLGTASVTVMVDENDAAAHIVRITGPDASVAEGGMATFTLNLPAVAGGNARTTSLTVAYSVAGSSTLTSTDYTTPSGSVTFTASQTEQTVVITTLDDSVNEGDETLTLRLGEVTMGSGFPGGAIAIGSASATITDNDPITYSIDATTGMEPASGSANMTFTVTLSGVSEGDVTIPYSVSDDSTATAGSDYTAPAAPLQFTVVAGQTTGTVNIALSPDTLHEADETIVLVLGATPFVGTGGGMVTLSATTGDDTGTGTIGGNDSLAVNLVYAGMQTSRDTDPVTVTEGASVNLRLELVSSGGRLAASAGDIFVTYTTAIDMQRGEANTGAEPDLALPQNNCGANRDTPVDVTVMADGSATGCVRIPAGMSTLNFSIEMRYDGLDEDGPNNMLPAEVVTVTPTAFMSSLGSSAAAISLTSTAFRQNRRIAINNVDSRRQISVAASAASVEETDGSTVAFTLTMTGAEVEAGMGFDLDWTILGTST